MTRHLPILAALALCPLPAAAGTIGVCTLAERLDRIVVAETGYPSARACPEVGFGALPEGAQMRSQAGAFDPATGRIELAPDLDLSDPFGQSYLLHEMVHAAQFAAGAHLHAPCPAALEAEAYTVQANFLRDQGLGREAVMLRVMADHLGSCAAPVAD